MRRRWQAEWRCARAAPRHVDLDTPAGGATGTALLVGTVLGEGRYRLCEPCGRGVDGEFWRGWDQRLDRTVGLTVLPAGTAEVSAAGMLTRACHAASAGPEHPALARVLDVLAPSDGLTNTDPVAGVVVSAWITGHALYQRARHASTRSAPVFLDDAPARAASAVLIARVAPLVDAADRAHRAGVVLGCAELERLRVSDKGTVVQAFAGPPADASPGQDVRGLGALLYLLLSGTWPLPTPAGTVPAAPTTSAGAPRFPNRPYRHTPLALSQLALDCLQAGYGPGITSTATLLNALRSQPFSQL